MTLMQQIKHGKQPMPPRMIVYGTEGIGKSTFAANAPDPIFIQTEDGLSEIDCDKFPLATRLEDVHDLPPDVIPEINREFRSFQDWIFR